MGSPQGVATDAKLGFSVMAYQSAEVSLGTVRRLRAHSCPNLRHVRAEAPYKARGISPRMEHGPWAARYFAASLYAQKWGYLPPTWDWVAQSLNVSAPPLCDGAFGSVRD